MPSIYGKDPKLVSQVINPVGIIPAERMAYLDEVMCRNQYTVFGNRTFFCCTRPANHYGDHLSHGLNTIVLRWSK